jgi:hypothetical protein
MLNVRRIEDDLTGEIDDDDEEVIRMLGDGKDVDGSVTNVSSSSLLLEGTLVSNLSSLIGIDSNLEKYILIIKYLFMITYSVF